LPNDLKKLSAQICFSAKTGTINPTSDMIMKFASKVFGS